MCKLGPVKDWKDNTEVVWTVKNVLEFNSLIQSRALQPFPSPGLLTLALYASYKANDCVSNLRILEKVQRE